LIKYKVKIAILDEVENINFIKVFVLRIIQFFYIFTGISLMKFFYIYNK